MESPNEISQTKNSLEREITQIIPNYTNSKQNQITNQVECLIQHQYSIFVPAIVLKYKIENKITKEKDFYGWDYDDLFEFFSGFGDIENLEISSNVAIILFKTFVDAYTTKEFLQNSSNFKDNDKNNFNIDWYKREDESYISEMFKEKIKRVTPSKILDNIQINTNKNSTNFNYEENLNITNNKKNDYINNNELIASNFNAQHNYFATWCLSPIARNEFNTILNNQPIYNINYNKYGYDFDESKNYSSDKNLFNGKYTCKFEIQIENDNEFQVARRLIGAKVKF